VQAHSWTLLERHNSIPHSLQIHGLGVLKAHHQLLLKFLTLGENLHTVTASSTFGDLLFLLYRAELVELDL
jgi:hypothetical protein